MPLFGGGNPISVAANFRLVFDTRSYARTASAYDSAMSDLMSKGHSKMHQSNEMLAKEHAHLVEQVKQDNIKAEVEFMQRSKTSTNALVQDSLRATKASQHQAGMGAAKISGDAGALTKHTKRYKAALMEMAQANKIYAAGTAKVGLDFMRDTPAGPMFDAGAFEQASAPDRSLAIQATEEELANREMTEEVEKEIKRILELQNKIHKRQIELEKELNVTKRKGKNITDADARAKDKAAKNNEIALKKYKQNLMEANMLLQQMSSQISMGLTQALMASTIALVGFGFKLQQIISSFKDFEQELRNANSIWQETNETLFQASDTILKFGTRYGIELQGATEGLYQMASAGLTAAESTEILNDTLKLSMAVQGDHETLAKLTIQTIKGFGLEMADSAELTDKMAHSINKSLIEWNDLASAVKFAMPFFVSMNQEVDQLFGALQILTDRALEAGIAGRGLRQAIAQFAKHADDNTAAFKRMGVEVTDSQGNFLQLTEIAKNFSDQFGENISDTEQMTTLLEDLNVRGATAFIHLVQNADEFASAVDDLQNSQGAAAKMADMQNISLNNQILIMKNAAAAALFQSDSTYEALGAMNEFDYLIKVAISDFRDFLFIQTETGLILSKNGELIKTLVLTMMRELIGLARTVYENFDRFAGSGENLANILHAATIPMKVAAQLLGMLGEGGLQAFIMYKMMNAVIPMNSMLMIANQKATLAKAEADFTAGAGLGQLAALQGAANMVMFAGFVMMNKSSEGAQKLGQVLVALAGAYYGVAIARSMASTKLPIYGQIAAGVAGAAAFVQFAKVMQSSMKVEPMDYQPVQWEGYGDFPTYDSGGPVMPVRGTHQMALLEAGEQVVPRTQTGNASGINIIIQGDVYDGDNFARTVAEALPNALGHASGTGSLNIQTKVQGTGLGRRAIARAV